MGSEDGSNVRQKCENGSCTCVVPDGQKFCSDYCSAPEDIEQSALEGEVGCKCGHEGCTD